jgi:3-hydroxyacyl-CoA dehydrogenase/enoyl-CoA hydratase/3-hydroxybutyryl-CoA epimerase
MSKMITGKYENWSLNLDEYNILWCTFDRKDSSANTLNEPILRELDQILNGIAQGTQAKALVIQSGKSTGFIVGADILQFKNLRSAEEATKLILKGQEVFNKLENLAIPTIAAISGFCLGGGLELALACRYRIAEEGDKTRLGLPEVKLGFHPGWGGTIRLPDLIGALPAMDLILSGRLVNGKTAKKLGFVDECVPKRTFLKAVKYYALNAPVKQGMMNNMKQKVAGLSNHKLVRPLLAKLLYKQLNSKIKQTDYPAPYITVNNWVEYGVSKPEGLLNEANSIGSLIISETAQNLVSVFFKQEALKNLAKSSVDPIKHVHVIGAGVMGGDIAAWAALKGFQVTLQDQAPKFIAGAIKRAYDLGKKQLKEKHLITQMMDRLTPDVEGRGIAKADLIIEAISEKLEAKQNLFRMLETKAKSTAVFATNTSTIPLEEIAEALTQTNRQRLVGIHFFNPVPKMPLVEIIHSQYTSQQVLDRSSVFVRKIDKLPLPVKSAPGFLVNRILLPYMMEAVTMLQEGIPGPVIDKAARDFGMPMGPIELADKVGLDVCLHALEKLTTSLGTGHHTPVPEELKNLVSQGYLGVKTGRGFYTYDKKGKIIKNATTSKTITDKPADMIERLIFRMLNEAVACLREGVVTSAEYLDAGCIFGFGFPPFRGGPMTYIQKEGNDKLLKQLKALAAQYGNRFQPDKGWERVA